MLRQLLNREFVLSQVDEINQLLATGTDIPQAPERKRRETLSDANTASEWVLDGELPPNAAEVREALDLLENAVSSERKQSSGQPGFQLPTVNRRNDGPEPIDDTAFFSRDPVLSNFQSALELYYRQDQESCTDEGSLVARDVATSDHSIVGLETKSESADDGRRVFEKFSITDPGWLSSVFSMGIRKMRNRHPFNPIPAPPITLATDARIILVGDWGSGVPRARRVADNIRAEVNEAKDTGRQVHIIHLGDVYYSGWKYEYEQRFLRWWPVDVTDIGNCSKAVNSWCLNGNHDMYAGGHSYFNVALADPRFSGHRTADGKASSFFSLENSHWTVLGLDTGWEDHGLKEPQADWAARRLYSNPGKGLLLSHHQIFSTNETIKPDNPLTVKTQSLLDSGRVCGWFWGHEHRAIAYAPIPGLKYPRCIGHGGVPVYASLGPTDPLHEGIVWQNRKSFTEGLETWALFGYSVLDLDGPRINVRYVDEDGCINYQEILE